MPESESHLLIKQKIRSKLHEWFGASIDEYYSVGHELDTFAVTNSGTSIYIEIVWSHSMSQFLKDMNMLQQSDAEVKVVIGSPKVIVDYNIIREFSKIVISQRRNGIKIHGDIINGIIILEDNFYVENDFKSILFNLVNEAKKTTKSDACLQITSLNVQKTNWTKGNYYNVIGKIYCKGQRIVKRLDASLEFVNKETQIKLVSVSDKGKANQINLKDLNYSWSPDGTYNRNIRGEYEEMRQGDSVFVVFPDAVGYDLRVNTFSCCGKSFFELTPGSKYEIRLVIRGLSGSETVSTDKTIEFIT